MSPIARLGAVLQRPEIRKRLPHIVAAGAGLVLLVAGGFWLADKHRYQATDNAYVKADTVIVSPQIEGLVARVLVEDNEAVQAGQVLVELDPAEVAARLAQAEANVAALRAGARFASARAEAGRSQIVERQASIASAEAASRIAQSELERYARLSEGGWVATQRLQTARAQADQAAAGVRQARASLASQQREAAAMGAEGAQAAAAARQAEAALTQARIDVDRAVIRAPVAGVVGARGVRAGQYVRPGANLMSIVPLGETYVVANFKETQVARMRIGQRVSIRADAFGDARVTGRIASFSPATGSEFALIPVENATGNFTKIVQRVPVKIAVDRADALAAALRPGLSISVKVDLQSQGGATFAESAAGDARLVQRQAPEAAE